MTPGSRLNVAEEQTARREGTILCAVNRRLLSRVDCLKGGVEYVKGQKGTEGERREEDGLKKKKKKPQPITDFLCQAGLSRLKERATADSTNLMWQQFSLRRATAEDSVPHSSFFLSTHWISVMSRIKDDKKEKQSPKPAARGESALLARISG